MVRRVVPAQIPALALALVVELAALASLAFLLGWSYSAGQLRTDGSWYRYRC
jgi:hypothetical protein